MTPMRFLSTACLCAPAVLPGVVIAENVYIMSGGQAAIDNAAIAALTLHGHTPTLGVRLQDFDGTQNLAGYDTVYMQANFNWSSGAMPVAGQQALRDWVLSGGRLVISEWAVFLANSSFSQLNDIFPVRLQSWNSNISTVYDVAVHDSVIGDGVPNSLAFPLVSYGGTETWAFTKPMRVVYYTTQGFGTVAPGLVGWRRGNGSVFWFSTTCGPAQLQDQNFGRLFANVMRAPIPCYANCDGSSIEPRLNVDDFTCFINAYATAQSLTSAEQLVHTSNCDGSSTAPVLNVDDFTCFINAFAVGCG